MTALNQIFEKLRECLSPAAVFSLRYQRAQITGALRRLSGTHPADDVANEVESQANQDWPIQIAVFEDLIPRPDLDAGSARMMFILGALAEWSHLVFVMTGERLWPEYEKLLWDKGIEVASAFEYKKLLRERKFRTVILSRPWVAAALLPRIRRADPTVKIVYDMLDVHHIRSAREFALTGDPRYARESKRLRDLEITTARAADLVWCGSPVDQEVMAREAPGVPSVVVPTIHKLHARGLAFVERKDLLFVGNFGHRPNTDAVHFFAREVMPMIHRAHPEMRLLVVGVNAPPEFADYENQGIHVLGYVADLDPLMASCRAFVAPIRFGSGVNGKIGEALSYGLPVVTTTIGAEGWRFTDGEQVLIADEPHDFAKKVVSVYEDNVLWKKLSDSGYLHITGNNTPEVVGNIINDSVKNVGAQRP